MAIDKPKLMQHVELARDVHQAEDALLRLLSPRATRFFYAAETDRLRKSHNAALGRLKSRLEETMFETYPNLGNEWTQLYYGDMEDIDALYESMQGGVTAGQYDMQLLARCEELADKCDRLAKSVERLSLPAGQAVYNAAANLYDATAMLQSFMM